LKAGESFIFETVFSTESKLDFIKEAKSKGYHVTVIYITTSDPQINIERAAKRQASGGHGVPTDKLIARWHRSMDLMFDVLKEADEARVYDNSKNHPVLVFAKLSYGTAFLLNRERRAPWVKTYITQKAEQNGILLSDLSYSDAQKLLASDTACE